MKKTQTYRAIAMILMLSVFAACLYGCFGSKEVTQFIDGIVRCYAEPSVRSEVLKTFDNGLEITYDTITIVNDAEWIETKYGWVKLPTGEESEPEGSVHDARIAFVTAASVTVRSGPGETYNEVDQLSVGTCVSFTETASGEGGNWGKCEFGWIAYSAVYFPGTEGVNTGYAVVRENGASAYDTILNHGAAIAQMETGERIAVSEIININGTEWAYTEKGWVNMTDIYLEGRTGTRPCNGMVIDSTPLNVRVGPSTDYDVNTTLNYGRYVTVKERIRCNGHDWGYIGNGWIYMDLVSINPAG